MLAVINFNLVGLSANIIGGTGQTVGFFHQSGLLQPANDFHQQCFGFLHSIRDCFAPLSGLAVNSGRAGCIGVSLQRCR